MRITLLLVIMSIALAGMPRAASAADMEFVTVGNPGNAPDTRHDAVGFGAVPYVFRMGKFEVTNGQYREFLNAKAALSDEFGLYNPEMTSSLGGIERTGLGFDFDPWVYVPKGGDATWDDRPVNFASFWDFARFVNWMHNGQGNGDTENGAYVGIGDESTFARQPGAKYFIPTENEWYKAAYYDPNKPGGAGYWEYPTRSDQIPLNDAPPGDDFTNGSANYGSTYLTAVGAFSAKPSTSAYGTYDQGGNLWEWNETFVLDTYFGLRGGSFDNVYGLDATHQDSYPAFFENRIMGFRVAAIVPEPSGMGLLAMGITALTCLLRGCRPYPRRQSRPASGQQTHPTHESP